MSNYISGSSSKIGAHIESSFNEARADSPYQIRMTSESLQATYNKLDEGVLMASKTQPEQELGSVSVSGDVSTVLNPSFIKWLMKATLGKEYNYGTEATPVYEQETVIGREGYDDNGTPNDPSDDLPTGRDAVQRERTYLLADVNADLPSSAIELWRGNQGFYYSGMTVSNMTLEAPAQDFVKADATFNGTQETYLGDNPTGVEKITEATFGGSYKCTKAMLRKLDAGSDISQFDQILSWDKDQCPAQQVYDVETSTLTVDNGIEETPATYCSGLYANQPGHGQRSVTIACNVPYSNSFETFRQTYYAKEDPDKLALMLQFATKENYTYYPTESPSIPSTIPMHQVLIILPYISISDISANAGGSGMIEGSFTGTALSVGDTEPIKVIIRDYDWQSHVEPSNP